MENEGLLPCSDLATGYYSEPANPFHALVYLLTDSFNVIPSTSMSAKWSPLGILFISSSTDFIVYIITKVIITVLYTCSPRFDEAS